MSTRQCAVDGCSKPRIALGLCSTDYARYRRGKLPAYELPARRPYTYRTRRAATGVCEFQGCDRLMRSRGLCETHAEQSRRGAALTPIQKSPVERGCKTDGCCRPHEAHGYCGTHYTHAVGRAEVAVAARRSRRINGFGYAMIFVPGHPCAQKSGYALESHVVMSAILNRPLLPGENVHHRNGVRDDNRPENLELWLTSQPKGQRVTDAVAWAKEILARYEPDALA